MELVDKFGGIQGAIRAVRFNKDGNYCISCGADKTVVLWNPYKKLKLQTYSGHNQEVLDADCSHDHAFLCTGSLDKTILYFDVSTAKILRKFRGHAGRVQCVRFNKDESNCIISGSIDGKVKIWDLRAKTFDPIQEIEDFKDSVTYIDLNVQQMLISCLDKHTRLYDVRFGRMFDDFIGEQVTCARLSKDGHCNVVSVLANKVLLYDKSNGELLNEYGGHVNKSYQIENCMNNDLNEIISGSEDGFVYIWDLVDAKIKQKLKHSSDRSVHSLNYHPDHDKLITAQEQFIYLWEKKIKV